MMSSSKDNDSYKIFRFDIIRGKKYVTLRTSEKPYGNVKDVIKVIGPDTWITSDIHINEDRGRTKRIIDNINNHVGTDGHILFLGDIGHKRDGSFKSISEAIKSIKTPNKYLILGNHDMYTISDYVSMGFKFVDDKISIPYGSGKIIFTHVPYDLSTGGRHHIINIHGHLHGANTYYEVDPKNHFDDYLTWNESYVRTKIITKPTTQGYPPIQQLKDLLRWIYTWD